ncbi:Cof-type HAD-IIB family hydrolase [Wukongibacter baidiensis]|uniref:Cof-type HAD-IIB family hydrolase n=1 Tax=Wukongibacter baidiensis TaxID=1723361 RepID=UPI003D7F57CB
MKFKLVAVDLDGTLLNKKEEIGKQTMELVKEAIAKGVKFAMCSARMYLPTKYYNVQIDKHQPVITSNGGLITEYEKVISSYPIASDELIEIITVAREEKEGIYFSFGHGSYLKNYICTNIDGFARYIRYEYNQMVYPEFRVDARLLKDPIRYITKNNIETYIISFVDENPLVLERLKGRLKRLNKYEITSSEANNIEITQKDVSKGNALKILANHYGYSIDECIAVGNDRNDLSMIKVAGLGVAMKNSSSYIKEHANYITEHDNENEGVAEVIKRFILL